MDDLRKRISEFMGEERRLRAAEAFWSSHEQKPAQRQVEMLLAQRLKARPAFIKKLPAAKKAQYLSRDMVMNPYLWDAAMIAYHFAHHRDMLGQFLSAVGIPNDRGHYESDSVPKEPPPADKIEEAVQGLLATYDQTDVGVYLGALVIQDAAFWEHLRPLVDRMVGEPQAAGS